MAYARRRSDRSAVAHLAKLGLLGPKLTIGHGVWLTEGDIELLAETGTKVCHNPSSNLRLHSGIAPLNEILKAGVTVGLGIDEAGINDDRDMLQEMRLALNLNRLPGIGVRVPAASEVFSAATVGGASTTPFGDLVGELSIGRLADAIVFDLDQISGAYLDPDVDLIDALVHRAKSSSVEAVVIGGRLVYANGAFDAVQPEDVIREIRHRMGRVDQAAVRSSRRRFASVAASVEEYYSDWPAILRHRNLFSG